MDRRIDPVCSPGIVMLDQTAVQRSVASGSASKKGSGSKAGQFQSYLLVDQTVTDDEALPQSFKMSRYGFFFPSKG